MEHYRKMPAAGEGLLMNISTLGTVHQGISTGFMSSLCQAVTERTSLWFVQSKIFDSLNPSTISILLPAWNQISIHFVSWWLLNCASGRGRPCAGTVTLTAPTADVPARRLQAVIWCGSIQWMNQFQQKKKNSLCQWRYFPQGLHRRTEPRYRWPARELETFVSRHQPEAWRPASVLVLILGLQICLEDDVCCITSWHRLGELKKRPHARLWCGLLTLWDEYVLPNMEGLHRRSSVSQLCNEPSKRWERECLGVHFVKCLHKRVLIFWELIWQRQMVHVGSIAICYDRYSVEQVKRELSNSHTALEE